MMRVIAGSGRSGTTWVLDCLADANALRPVFEPLNPEFSSVGLRYAHKLVEPGDSHPDLKKYLEHVQQIGFRSIWTTYRGIPGRLFPGFGFATSTNGIGILYQRWRRFLRTARKLHAAAKRRDPIVKFIRANLALGWIVKNLDARVVLLVRHPCAVVESKYRLGKLTRVWDPRPIVKLYVEDQGFNERTKGAYLPLLKARLTDIEALTLLWVIDNQNPIERAGCLGYAVVYYEDLLAQPEMQWQRMCAALELGRIPSVSSRHRPSQQAASSTSGTLDFPEQGWISRLDPSQLAQIQGILDKTHFTRYHTNSPDPVSSPGY